jgi:DNA-binding transcriptional MerR regulator
VVIVVVGYKDMITVGRLAKKLGLDPDTLRSWADQKKVKSYRHPINNYRLFREEEVRKDLDIDSGDSISSGAQTQEIRP